MYNMIPFRKQENSMFSLFDKFEKEFWNNSVSGLGRFRADVVEQGDTYILKAELPGFNKEDIQIDIDGNMLVITAKNEQAKEDAGDKYIRRERRYGSFSRSFDISGIDAGQIQARYADGILSLVLPKSQPRQLPPTRQIQIL